MKMYKAKHKVINVIKIQKFNKENKNVFKLLGKTIYGHKFFYVNIYLLYSVFKIKSYKTCF